MKSNVKSLLGNLKEKAESNTIKITVPSTGKKVDFKHACISQQKDLIRTVFDGVDGVIKRTNIFNKIIKDNSVEDIDFLIIDRSRILIDIRKETLGGTYKHKDIEYDLNDLPSFDLSEVKLKRKVSHDGITVNLAVPTLTLDTEVNTKVELEFAKLTDEKDKRKESVNLIVAYETAKYIVDVSVGDETIVFEDVSVYERKQIVDNLPLTLNNKIVNYIGSVKEVIDKSCTFSDEVVVEIDSNFLSAD